MRADVVAVRRSVRVADPNPDPVRRNGTTMSAKPVQWPSIVDGGSKSMSLVRHRRWPQSALVVQGVLGSTPTD